MFLVVDKGGLLLEPSNVHLRLGSHSDLEADHAVLLVLDNARLLNDRGRKHVVLADASLIALELQNNIRNALAQLVDHNASVCTGIGILRFLGDQIKGIQMSVNFGDLYFRYRIMQNIIHVYFIINLRILKIIRLFNFCKNLKIVLNFLWIEQSSDTILRLCNKTSDRFF